MEAIRCPECGKNAFIVVVDGLRKTAICGSDACLFAWDVSEKEIIKKGKGEGG